MWLLCPTSLTGSLVLEDACCCFLSAAPFKVNVSRTETHFEWIIYFQPILWPQNQILPKKVLKLGNRFDFFISHTSSSSQSRYLSSICMYVLWQSTNTEYQIQCYSMLKSPLVLFFDFQKSNSSTVCILLRGIFCDNCLELDSHHFPVYYYYLVGMSNQVVHYESIEEILSVWPDMDCTCCR